MEPPEAYLHITMTTRSRFIDNLRANRPVVQFYRGIARMLACGRFSMNWNDFSEGPSLRWTQPALMKMNYQLGRGDSTVASLRFKSLWGSLATAENEDGCWTFKRVGFWQTRATIRACGSESEIATFKNNTWTGGGTLEFPDGRRIRATTNAWQTKLEFQTETGESLIRFKYDTVWCNSATVGILPPALTMPETSWIVAFGWYLMVMMQMDMSAGVVGSTGGTAG
jgi:hypothetical protein